MQISPELWWGLGLLAALAPILWGLNVLLLLYWMARPGWWALPQLVAVVAGLGLVTDTVAVSFKSSVKPSSLGVLSYNLSHFNRPKEYLWARDSSRLRDARQLSDFVDWVVSHPAAIKCFQEYYTYPDDPFYDAHSRLKQQGWAHSYLAVDTLRVNKSVYGLAIYSKDPIVAAGLVFKGSTSFNKGIWADIALASGDTLRVINVHLESAQLQRTRYRSQGKKETLRNLVWVTRHSMVQRAQQAEQVLRFAQMSPYPVLISGDFNSTPYSYTYQQLDRRYQNAFEKKGNGIGFTLNHPKLFFLRIDHQFASNSLKVCDFQTRREVPYSDHYPIEGWYQITAKKE